MPDRRPIFVYLLPSLIPPGALRGGVAVVVDVLRATTVMVQALASGCEAVIPCLEIDEARRVAASLPPGSALLGGERQGLPIEGFDLGNSPGSYTPETCRGKTLVMTTTNGTRAILASLEAERVLIAAFPNLGATARVLAAQDREVHVVCSGTDGRISLEDAILAGAIVHGLARPGEAGSSASPLADDEAEMVAGLWRQVRREVREGEPLASVLGRGRGGRRVRQLGLSADILDAAQVDRTDRVAELLRDPLRIVRTDGPTF